MVSKKEVLSKPVATIEVGRKSVSALLDEMSQTGFQGKKLGEVASIWAEMARQKDLTVFLGLTGSLSTTGQWKIIRWLIEKRYVDVLVSTGANISEDILEALGYHYYQGTWLANDEELLKLKIDRFTTSTRTSSSTGSWRTPSTSSRAHWTRRVSTPPGSFSTSSGSTCQ